MDIMNVSWSSKLLVKGNNRIRGKVVFACNVLVQEMNEHLVHWMSFLKPTYGSLIFPQTIENRLRNQLARNCVWEDRGGVEPTVPQPFCHVSYIERK